MHKKFAWAAATSLTLAMACAPQLADTPETRAALQQRPALPGYNLARDGVAIDGYDPVAYFPEGGGAPTKGNPAIAESYQGVIYHFANDANRERFRENPGRYEPAYGGWCAYAMAKGNKIGVDPEAYIIQNDRLLLFFKTGVADTRDKWHDKPDSMLVDADINWRDISGECPSSRRAAAMSSAQEGETSPDESEASADDQEPAPEEAASPRAEGEGEVPADSGAPVSAGEPDHTNGQTPSSTPHQAPQNEEEQP